MISWLSHLPKSFSKPFFKGFPYSWSGAAGGDYSATLFAMLEEVHARSQSAECNWTDILLMFIYLEVLAMVQQFVMNGKIPCVIQSHRDDGDRSLHYSGNGRTRCVPIVWLSLAVMLVLAGLQPLLIRAVITYRPYVDLRTNSRTRKPSIYKSFKSPAMLLGFLLSSWVSKRHFGVFLLLVSVVLVTLLVWFYLDI